MEAIKAQDKAWVLQGGFSKGNFSPEDWQSIWMKAEESV